MKLSDAIDKDKLNALIENNILINSNYSNISALLAHILESAMRLVSGDASSLLLVDQKNPYAPVRDCARSKGT